MSAENNQNQEVDLSQISKKIGSFFEEVSTKIFKFFLFIRRNILVLSILLILGVGIGLFLDKKIKSYENEIIVAPNFGSNDYLYSKIQLINSKILENDTVFLEKVVGIKNPSQFRKITIEPIIDVYKFIDNNEANFELIKLMSENGDLKKILEEETTSKNYPYHRIQFITTQLTSDQETVQPIMDFLNESEYYKVIQKEFMNNVVTKLRQNDSIIKQIDGVLNSFTGAVNGSQRNDKLIYYNENTQLNDVIKTKNELVYEQGIHRIELVNLDKVIKGNSSTINIKQRKGLAGKFTILLPFLFIFIFFLVTFLKKYYRNQLAKSNL